MENMAASQINDKRLKMRKDIRKKHIDSLFQKQRVRQINTHTADKNEQNIQNYSNQTSSKNSHAHSANRININGQSRQAKVNKIISASQGKGVRLQQLWGGKDKKLSIFQPQSQKKLNKFVYLNDDAIRNIWSIVLSAQTQKCLDQHSMQVLISNANSDIKNLLNILNNTDIHTIKNIKQQNTAQKNVKKLHISQRLGQMLWILLNQCYKIPIIKIQIAIEIIQICVQIININKIDEYIIGLCVILLGNICVSQLHVQQIIKQIKISNLMFMLQKSVSVNNLQDLSFLLSNMLFYYPCFNDDMCIQQEVSYNTMNEIKNTNIFRLRCQQKQQLTAILQWLYNKLYIDLLNSMHIYTQQTLILQSKQSKTPIKSNKKQLLTKSQIQSKSNTIINNMLNLSQQQLISLQQNRYNCTSSQYYTNDLMQCITKTKQLLHQLVSKQCYENQNGSSICYSTNNASMIHDTINGMQAKVLDVCFRLLFKNMQRIQHYCGQQQMWQRSSVENVYTVTSTPNKTNISNQKQIQYNNIMLKYRNVLVFIRDIYRSFTNHNNNTTHAQHNQQQHLHDIIINKYSQLLTQQFHKFITNDNNFHNINKYGISMLNNDIIAEMNVMEDVQQAVWELYSRYMCILAVKVQENVSSKCRDTLQQEIQWIQMKLVSNKQPVQATWQTKLMSILSKIYPFIQKTKIKKQPNKNNRQRKRDSLILLRNSQQHSSSSHKSYTQSQLIQIDMVKLSQLLSLFQCKIKQHINCNIMLLSVLHAVHNVINRVKVCFKDAALQSSNGHRDRNMSEESGEKFPIQDILGDSLYKLISQELRYSYQGNSEEDGSVYQQIKEVIDEILYNDQQSMEEMQGIQEDENQNQEISYNYV